MKQEPAFPVVGHLTDDLKMMGQLHHGMTLRDYFAAKVLPAIYTEFWAGVRGGECGVTPDWREGVSRDAYKLADAMLKARETAE